HVFQIMRIGGHNAMQAPDERQLARGIDDRRQGDNRRTRTLAGSTQAGRAGSGIGDDGRKLQRFRDLACGKRDCVGARRLRRCASMMVESVGSVSACSAMRFMVATASTGYWPEADSAESMIASAPSSTAVATSDTSARVGTGAVIIDSSICVATTTGLPARRA